MSSRIFQSVVVQMKDAVSRPIGVVDSEGVVVACSDLSLVGSQIISADNVASMIGDKFYVFDGRTFRAMGRAYARYEYAVFVDGADELAESFCAMAEIAVSSANAYYEEKYDKSVLVKNVITDNILPGDIYIHARELHFTEDVSRAVFFIRQVGRANIEALDALRRLFPERQKDFVIFINETDVAVIKEVADNIEAEELYSVANSIQKTLSDELNVNTVIGIGTIAHQLSELAVRYKEAQVAIEVGKVFDTEKTIINYESMGIGRLIYQLPTTMCEMFLSEIFKKSPIEALDEETLSIITEFFDNNLNISETSRKLFIHRNTLVYRLGKIKKLTGLDLREFDQAIVFKVALMVKKYLNSQK